MDSSGKCKQDVRQEVPSLHSHGKTKLKPNTDQSSFVRTPESSCSNQANAQPVKSHN